VPKAEPIANTVVTTIKLLFAKAILSVSQKCRLPGTLTNAKDYLW